MPGDFTRLPMFARLQPSERDRLRAISWTRRYPKGQVVCSEGDPADYLLILVAGTLKAGRHTATGREVVLGVHTPPAAFDKAALLATGQHLATLTALTPVTIRYLPAAAFMELVDREPSVRQRVMATLAVTLRSRTQQLTDIATLDVPGRLAKWLLDRAAAEPAGVHSVLTARLPAPQSDLAAELGTTRVTINRAFRDFQAAGLIAVRPGLVLLLAPDRLVARYEPSATVRRSPSPQPIRLVGRRHVNPPEERG